MTDFVLTSLQDAAQCTIDEHSQLAFSVRDSDAFVDALLNPQPVNDRLRDTVRRDPNGRFWAQKIRGR